MCRDVMMWCHFAKSKSDARLNEFYKEKTFDDDWNKYYEDKVLKLK